MAFPILISNLFSQNISTISFPLVSVLAYVQRTVFLTLLITKTYSDQLGV